ncbi:M23/M56 family metallopeptidase [Reichenbachiella sp. MALMAid0571]|uniref:M23/M56 family metallopeptidase n=1 Tax=Reichenbachiella sp. MALMAid0571 TaxID=3143939 RepID=UPI0032DF0C06
MILYLLKSTMCLALLLGVYHLLLVRAGTFQFNRFFLLFGICFSLAIPLIQVETLKETISNELPVVLSISEFENELETIEIPTIAMLENENVMEDSKIGIFNSKGVLLLSIYLVVVLFLLTRYITNIRKLLTRIESADRIRYKNVRVNLIDENIAPHSFLNGIFICKEEFKTRIDDRLLTHELAHVQQKHSLDILFVEWIKIVFWFNPIITLYSKAIRTNHEYLADQTVIKSHKDITEYQYQLLEYLAKFKSPSFASHLNYSITKKRFKMMKKKISKTSATISIAMLVPVLLFALLAFSPAVKKIEQTIVENVIEIEASLDESTFIPKENTTPRISPIRQSDMIRMSSGFGKRKNPINQKEQIHSGIDFLAKTGVEVLTTADGAVEVAENQHGGYGKHIKIRHNDDCQTFYAHLNELMVSVGDKVKMGDVIGTVGSTGKSTAPHLHYAVIKDDKHVNPVNYIPSMSTNKIWQEEVEGTKSNDNPKSKGSYSKFTIGSKTYRLDNIVRTVLKTKPSPIHRIMYNDSIGVVMYYDKEPVFRKLDEFTDLEKSILNAPPEKREKVSPTQKQLDDWLDPNIYGIWLDGARISNEKLKEYEPDDFSSVFVSGLEKNAKNYGKHKFQVDIGTNEARSLSDFQ